jgi:hypothetical protein
MSITLPTFECVTVPIPVEVADFMEEVWSRIEWHDETVEQVSDDLIQAPNIAPIIGGIENLESKWFRFDYTACESPETRWHLYLFDNEIEDIAKRRVTSLTLWKCTKSSCRHLFTYKSDVYCECHP